MRQITTRVGAGLIAAALIVAGTTTYLNSTQRSESLVFSNQSMLAQLWDTAKVSQIEAGSYRTVDRADSNVSTSAGESNTLLRAVWIDDQTTFDHSLTWTNDNLKRPSDGLYSSRYGERADGSYGILTNVGGDNASSGADTDIALALVMASQRWHEQKYLDMAEPLIQSIWKEEVVSANGKPVLVANNVEQNNEDNVLVNPSYFSPYAYKVFAQIDTKHDWNGLRDNSYAILAAAQASNLDKSSTDGLIPNWIMVNRETGAISAATGTNLDSNYGYDAMQVPFRLALDYAWFNDPRDKAILTSMSYLANSWTNNGSLASIYSHDSQSLNTSESPAVYGGDIGYFQVVRPDLAKQVYTKKLASIYDANGEDWKASLNYYDDNWAWLGLALYNHELPNLTNVQ